jgi:hypothetical protein
MSVSEAPETTPETRRLVLELLNEAISAEYHSFVGHALGSNPFVAPGHEKDLELLDRIRDEENESTRALLLQLGRYRAGPTIRAFRWWKHDLNFLGLDFLVIKAAEVAKEEAARTERLLARLPVGDAQLRATIEPILAIKRRHADELGKAAAVRQKERDAKRAAQHAVTGIAIKKPGAPAAAKPAAAAAPAAGGAPKAPALPGAPKAPPLPGAPKAPPLPGAPKPPSPPLPGGGPKPPSPPKPPGPPSPPKPPA